MSLILFIIVVVILLALVLWAIESAPLPAPTNWILRVLAIVLAIVVIANRAGVF